MVEEQRGKQKPSWLITLHEALNGVPSDYRERYRQIVAMRHQILQEIAGAVAGSLNAYLQMAPQETLEQKRELAAMVNRDLRELNLAVRCPVTRMPAILVVDAGYMDRTSKFRFQSFDASGHRWRKGVSSAAPAVELIDLRQSARNH